MIPDEICYHCLGTGIVGIGTAVCNICGGTGLRPEEPKIEMILEVEA